MALFWGPKKEVARSEMSLSLPDFMQAQIYSEVSYVVFWKFVVACVLLGQIIETRSGFVSLLILHILYLLYQGDSTKSENMTKVSVSVVSSISEVSSDDWDACSLDATGPKQFNPFLTHNFLLSLEESGSAVKVCKGCVPPLLHFS